MQALELESYRFTFPSPLRAVLGLLLVCNVLDLTFTLAWIFAGHATEANQLMAASLQLGPVAFALAKLGLVSGGGFVLLELRREKFAQLGLSLTTGVYVLVCCYHVSHLLSLVA